MIENYLPAVIVGAFLLWLFLARSKRGLAQTTMGTLARDHGWEEFADPKPSAPDRGLSRRRRATAMTAPHPT